VETWRQRAHNGNLLTEELLFVSRYAPFPDRMPGRGDGEAS
jgi:hypothetical protein